MINPAAKTWIDSTYGALPEWVQALAAFGLVFGLFGLLMLGHWAPGFLRRAYLHAGGPDYPPDYRMTAKDWALALALSIGFAFVMAAFLLLVVPSWVATACFHGVSRLWMASKQPAGAWHQRFNGWR